MRTNRNPLSRDATDLMTDHRALASLLSAATSQASGRELAGEDDAVLAFRYAHLGPAPRSRRSSMSVTKLLAVKALIAAVGLTGGGVALAAATGHMPSVTGSSSAAAGSAANATASHSAGGQSASHPTASPSPSLRGLCQAYTAHAADNPGKALDNPAFTALITAAGGKASVSGFCANMLAAKPGNAPTAHSTGKPSSMPTTANTTHPSGKPTAHPSGKPTQQP
jgi:hypothetical protein